MDEYTQPDPLDHDADLRQARDGAFDDFSRGLRVFHTVRVEEPARLLWIDSKEAVNELIIGVNLPNFMDKRACILAMNSRPGRALEAVQRRLKRIQDPASTLQEESPDFLRALNEGRMIGDLGVVLVVEFTELHQFSAWLGRIAAAQGTGVGPEQPPSELTGDDWRRIYVNGPPRQYRTIAGHSAHQREDPFGFLRERGWAPTDPQ